MDALKKELRKKTRELIKAQDYENRLKNGDKMADVLLNSSLWNEAESVFCFYSLPSEPSTLKIIDAALLQGKKLCLPKCEEKFLKALFFRFYFSLLTNSQFYIIINVDRNTIIRGADKIG